MKRSGNPAKRAWDPIKMGAPNPASPMAQAFYESSGMRHYYRYRTPMKATDLRAFGNRLYNGMVITFEDGSMHLSFKRNDRSAIHDWRHFQAIKNEVAGPEREAIEIYPPESNLVDAANEYHLWVLPPNVGSPLGMEGGTALMHAVDMMDHAAYRQGGPPGARQRPWEEGLPTGPGGPTNVEPLQPSTALPVSSRPVRHKRR